MIVYYLSLLRISIHSCVSDLVAAYWSNNWRIVTSWGLKYWQERQQSWKRQKIEELKMPRRLIHTSSVWHEQLQQNAAVQKLHNFAIYRTAIFWCSCSCVKRSSRESSFRYTKLAIAFSSELKQQTTMGFVNDFSCSRCAKIGYNVLGNLERRIKLLLCVK